MSKYPGVPAKIHGKTNKEYQRLYQYEWWRKNEDYRRYKHEWQREHRRKAIEVLGGKCIICGFEDYRALQIDHINRNLKQKKDKTTNLYTRIVAGNTENLQLLCANCHAIKSYENEDYSPNERILDTL